MNLALHVRGRRDDGYHDLDSVFVHTVDGDEMWVEPADEVTLTVTGPFGAELSTGDDNLVMRAARGLAQEFAAERSSPLHQKWMDEGILPRGAAITLVKNLPLASGIGGGSSDAATSMALLCALWDLPDDLDRLTDVAAALGADVPPCLTTCAKHVVGRGDNYDWLHDPTYRDWPILLVNPLQHAPTGQVFAAWDGVDHGPLPRPPAFTDVMACGRNDLTDAAISVVPDIAAILDALRDTAPMVARMSGSGATCFAIYASAAARDMAQSRIIAAHPGWWTLATRLQ